MYPVVFGNPRITSYGLMLVLAWLAAWFSARRRAARFAIPAHCLDALMPMLLVGMLAGAGAAGQLVPRSVPDFSNDHQLFGGLAVAAILVLVFARATRTPLGRLSDAFAFALPVGIGLLRSGCFLAGCCWGTLCDPRWPLGVTYPQGSPAYYQHILGGHIPADAARSLPVHPVPLYEATGVLVLLVALLLLDRHWRRWGESFLASGLGYCVLRFGLEWLRADTTVVVAGLTESQVACLGVAIVLVGTGATRRYRAAHGRTELYRRPPLGTEAPPATSVSTVLGSQSIGR